MSAIKIEGKSPISGIVKLSGNKNAILPMIAAAMLCDEEITLCNVPDILDVRSMLEIFAALGGKFEFQNNILSLSAASANTAVIPRELCSKNRTSILYAAPLLVRFGKVTPDESTNLLRPEIVGVIVSAGKNISTQQDAAFDLIAESGTAALEIGIDKVAPLFSVAVSDSVKSGKVGTCFGGSDDVVDRNGVLGVRKRNTDDFSTEALDGFDGILHHLIHSGSKS